MTRLKNTLCFAGVAAILSTLAAHAHAGAREGPQAPVAIEKVGHGPAAPLSDARRDRRTGYGLPGAAETMTPVELDAVRGQASDYFINIGGGFYRSGSILNGPALDGLAGTGLDGGALALGGAGETAATGLPASAEPMTPAELDAVRGMGEPPAHGFLDVPRIDDCCNLQGYSSTTSILNGPDLDGLAGTSLDGAALTLEDATGTAAPGLPAALEPMTPAELDAVRGMGTPPAHGFLDVPRIDDCCNLQAYSSTTSILNGPALDGLAESGLDGRALAFDDAGETAGTGLPAAAEPMTPPELDAVRGTGTPRAHTFWSGTVSSFRSDHTGVVQ